MKAAAGLKNHDIFFAPGRLRSLWDMLQLHAGPFLDALNRISRMAQMLNWMRAENRAPISISRTAFSEFLDHANAFREICLELQIQLTYLSAKQLVEVCEAILLDVHGDNMSIELPELLAMGARVDDIRSRIKDEMHLRLLFVMPSKNALYYEPLIPLFGAEFENKFPSVQFDLAEAGKCLALGRSTASVFHLMRIVEAGLDAVHSCLGIPVALVANDKSWGSVIKRIQQNIESRGNKWTEKEKFEELLMMLNAAKHAWRNPTMHLEKKYTDEEAGTILLAVRSLMKMLALRMDAAGVPMA